MRIYPPVISIMFLGISGAFLFLSCPGNEETGSAEPEILTCRIVNSYPHDADAFTQGLVYEDGYIYEGTGINGRSALRKVELETGRVVLSKKLSDRYFGEGIVIRGDNIIQLTWTSDIGFVYDKATFERKRSFRYPWQGWGLTYDGKNLIMSNGKSNLYYLDPETYKIIGEIAVYDGNKSVVGLNELEYIDGLVYANVWPTDTVVIIDMVSGRVTGKVDLSGLIERQGIRDPEKVPNGIAYDNENKRLFVTGKFWPELFEIELIPLDKSTGG